MTALQEPQEQVWGQGKCWKLRLQGKKVLTWMAEAEAGKDFLWLHGWWQSRAALCLPISPCCLSGND